MVDATMTELKDGYAIQRGRAGVIVNTLRKLANQFPFAVQELLDKCRNTEYQYFPPCREVLFNQGLIDVNGFVPDDVKHVTLCSVHIEGNTVRRVSVIEPYKEDEDA